MRNWLRAEAGILGLVVFQATAATILNFSSRDLLLHDDTVTFFTQGMMLWLGSFPPDPNRPILYPFFLSLGMRLFGLDLFGLRSLQVLALAATTALLHRQARILAGRPAAALAAGLYVIFPSALFQANELYRESITPFFFILTLNLLHDMLADPRRIVRALYAGTAAGLLVMIKPEFGTMMGVLAFLALLSAWRTGEWKTRAGPWVLCGLAALVTISPAVLHARAAFQEWIFICVNTGKYYAVSYCGSLETGNHKEDARDFFAKDSDRFARVNPEVNRVFFAPDSPLSFSERDTRLLRTAGRCIAQRPGQALSMVFHRGLLALFMFNLDPVWFIQGGRFGRHWPGWTVQTVLLLIMLVNMFTVWFLAPGLFVLAKKPTGRVAAAVILWSLVFYSSSFFRPRLLFAVYPALILAAVAGALYFPEGWKSLRFRGLFLLWTGCCAAGFGSVSAGSFVRLFQAENWTRPALITGSSEREKLGFILIMAQVMTETGRHDLLAGELWKYLELRKSEFPPELLLTGGDEFVKRNQFTTAEFFFRAAGGLHASQELAASRLARLAQMKQTVALDSWTRVGEDRRMGLAFYHSPVPGEIYAHPRFLDPQIQLQSAKTRFQYNPGLQEGRDLAPYQFSFQGNRLLIALPLADTPPSPLSPLLFTYFSSFPSATTR